MVIGVMEAVAGWRVKEKATDIGLRRLAER